MTPLIFDIPANWDTLSSVTDRARGYFIEAGATPDSAYAMSMITTEFCENAVKYGAKASAMVKVCLGCNGKEYVVEVSNQVDDSVVEDLQRLDDMVQWIRGFQDPFQAYVERLREVSAQRLDDGRSGLGLVRVAYEGRAVLDFIVNENKRLSVSAVRRD